MYYFSHDLTNIKNRDQYEIKVDEKSYKSIFTSHIGYVNLKGLS